MINALRRHSERIVLNAIVIVGIWIIDIRHSISSFSLLHKIDHARRIEDICVWG